MSMKDLNLIFDTKFALTTTGASTNTLDLVAAGDAMPAGVLTFFVAQVMTTFAGGVSLQVQLQTADDVNFNVNAATLLQSAVLAQSVLVAQSSTPGSAPPAQAPVFMAVVLPVGVRRFLRAYYIVNGTFSTGNINASLYNTIDKLLSPTLTALVKG